MIRLDPPSDGQYQMLLETMQRFNEACNLMGSSDGRCNEYGLETMQRFNEGCNDISKAAFDLHMANKIDLQKVVYYDIRERYGLSAQMTVRAIAKVVEAYKRDKSIRPDFRLEGSVVYDQRVLSWKIFEAITILTLEGRQKIPIRVGDPTFRI